MAPDLSPIHPDLHDVWNQFPRITFNAFTSRLMMWLTKLMPQPSAPADMVIENIFVQSRDRLHDIRLRVYRNKHREASAPVLLWMHGGGLVMGTPEQNDTYVFQLVEELGIVVVSVDYRLAPKHPFPTPLYDCYDALKWVHSNSQNLGFDANRIAVGGGSAGGGLAASLAQLAFDLDEVKVKFQLLVYPMLDDKSALRQDIKFPEFLSWNQKSNRYGWESYLQAPVGSNNIPPYAVASQREEFSELPPAWIGVGALDLFHDENVAYAEKLQQSGVDCELLIVPKAFHGFDVRAIDIPIVKEFHKSQLEALKKYLLKNE